MQRLLMKIASYSLTSSKELTVLFTISPPKPLNLKSHVLRQLPFNNITHSFKQRHAIDLQGCN